MAHQWLIDGPKVLDIGDEHERVASLKVGIVGGRVDVVTHDDSPTARLEISEVAGAPLRVTWDGATLKVTHGKDTESGVIEMIRRQLDPGSRNRVTLSISVPVESRANVSTVTAAALVSGIRGRVRANTVSGTLTLSDLAGDVDLNTVSGNVECHQLSGPLAANAVSGSVTVHASTLPKVRINTVSGDIALDLANARAEIASNSVSGDVTVRAPDGGFDVAANTATGQVVVHGRKLDGRSGHASSAADPHSEEPWQSGLPFGGGKHPRGARLREGDGALQIKANAVSGNLIVLRTGADTAASGPGGRDFDGTPQDSPPAPEAPQDSGGNPMAGPR